ncbi:conserved hypothetical protein (putative transposase or invertase) [Natronincola ferrireducens]|uniref:Transposase, YhgA-like n=1 Tax=Natronincola ferrireducens TaxID=393762 RepID=A0A1G8X8X1_9FIRM|nr:conserved hypothetical protein (putative transposase or invertase) [Natronincola ferrireducens]
MSGYTDEEIKGNARLRIFLKILRDIFEKDYEEFLVVLREAIIALDKIDKQEKGTEYFETFIRYIMNARNDLELRAVYDIAKGISVERRDVIMTIAEKLIKEGMEKGIEKGIEKTAEAAFRKGADIDFVVDITGLSMDKLREIKRRVKEEQN